MCRVRDILTIVINIIVIIIIVAFITMAKSNQLEATKLNACYRGGNVTFHQSAAVVVLDVAVPVNKRSKEEQDIEYKAPPFFLKILCNFFVFTPSTS
jgi:hypothetical protein